MASQDVQGVSRPATARPRLESWPERLSALIEACRDEPFVWGTHDCCSFAADAVVAVTGEDPMAGYRGRYTSEAEAERVLGASGLEGAALAALANFGAALCRPELAQRGDIALVKVGNEGMLGVVVGDRVAVPGIDSLVFVKTRDALRTWVI